MPASNPHHTASAKQGYIIDSVVAVDAKADDIMHECTLLYRLKQQD